MKKGLLEEFEAYVKTHHLFDRQDRIFIAVSGGLDSMVLCDLCKKAGFEVTWAHCNFQLREAESERDETFVTTRAAHYQQPLEVKKFDTATFAQQEGVSIQVAARDLRYAWFHQLLSAQEITKPHRSILLTAHHADDNIETLLMHLFRGTGIAGLTGIPRVNGAVVRPLLFATRAQLLAYAQEEGLQWVEDSSNSSTKYTRNYIRHEVIPVIEKMYPQLRQHLQEQITKFEGIETIFNEAVTAFKKRWVVEEAHQSKVPVKAVRQITSAETYLFEWLKPYGFSSAQMRDIMHLLSAESGKFVRSATHQLVRHRDWLILAPLSKEAAIHVLQQLPFECATSYFTLNGVALEGDLNVHSNTASQVELDAAQIQWPLVLRPWKTGDYFYPLGMRKKKKVARFLIDQKVSKIDKERIYVLESNGRIIWVVGQRIDDRFKITPSTQQAIRINWRSL